MNHLISACILSLLLTASIASAEDRCRTSHSLLGEHPSHALTAWSPSLQGIAHDRANWFITNVDGLFRIPAEVDLAGAASDASVLRVPIPPALTARGFDHFGDLSGYEHAGEGFLCVPMERRPEGAALAFFRGRDLAYLGAADLPDRSDWAPFCAIDVGGHAAVPEPGRATLRRYAIDWDGVARGHPGDLRPVGSINLRTESGEPFLADSFGGAEFSEDGLLLYVLTGFLDDHACPFWRGGFWTGGCGFDPERGGIHVFAVRHRSGELCRGPQLCEARRAERSLNPQHAGGGEKFVYRYQGTVLEAEEPEGITVWDLDSGDAPRTPHVRGQVHALLLDNELISAWDLVSIRHYAAEIDCPTALPADPSATRIPYESE